MKEICNKIEDLKSEHENMWYDFFIEKMCNFLKSKSREYNEIKEAKKVILFSNIEHFNKEINIQNEKYEIIKNDLKDDIYKFYEEKRISIEKKVHENIG